MNKKLDNKEILSRQSYLFNNLILDGRRIVCLGAGFVGSNIAYNFMRTGFKEFILSDFDIVEEGNILNQFFTKEDIGKKKTDALASRLEKDSPFDIFIHKYGRLEEILDNDLIINGDVVVVSTDNKESKLNVLKHFKNNLKKLDNTILIIIGTNSELIWITMLRGDEKKLNKLIKLFSQPEKNFSAGLCGMKSAFFIGSFISGTVIFELKNKYFNTFESKSNGLYIFNETLEIEDE